MDPENVAKQLLVSLYETLYEQERAIRRLDLSVASILETAKDLDVNFAETYEKHSKDKEQGQLARQHDAVLKDISEVIRKLKSSMPN